MKNFIKDKNYTQESMFEDSKNLNNQKYETNNFEKIKKVDIKNFFR